MECIIRFHRKVRKQDFMLTKGKIGASFHLFPRIKKYLIYVVTLVDFPFVHYLVALTMLLVSLNYLYQIGLFSKEIHYLICTFKRHHPCVFEKPLYEIQELTFFIKKRERMTTLPLTLSIPQEYCQICLQYLVFYNLDLLQLKERHFWKRQFEKE